MKRIVISLIALYIITSPVYGKEKPKLIDKQKALKACGFTEGIFSRKNKILNDLDDTIKKEIGIIEGNKQINTVEELLTAVHYSDFVPKDEKYRSVFFKEMSSGTETALKLGAMWLKKRVDTAQYYQNALDYICTKSKVTESEIFKYYQEAITAEIDRIVAMVLENTPRRLYTYKPEKGKVTVNAIDLIKNYYITPTSDNYKKLVEACKYFAHKGLRSDKYMFCFRAMLKIIGHLSPGLRRKVIRDIKKF